MWRLPGRFLDTSFRVLVPSRPLSRGASPPMGCEGLFRIEFRPCNLELEATATWPYRSEDNRRAGRVADEATMPLKFRSCITASSVRLASRHM